MSRLTREFTRVVLGNAAFLASVFACGVLPAQQSASDSSRDSSPSEIEIEHAVSGRPKIAIAVPDCYQEGAHEALTEASRTIQEVIRNDLDWSGVFSVVNPDYYKLVSKHSAKDIPFHDWASIGSELMLHITTIVEDGQLALEGRLFEVRKEREMILGKRYRGQFELVRKIAHTLSDAVIQKMTGANGVASTRICFVSSRTGAKEIFMMDYDGWEQRRITENRSLNLSPDWSPDNEMIAYTSYIRGFPDIFLMSKYGAANSVLISGKELHAAPAWAPRGDRVAFTSSMGGDTEIFVINKDATGLRRLTVSPGIDTSPSWSPTAREIVFTSDRSGSTQLWIMDAEGLNPRQLTRSGSFNDSAAWSPDGSQIAFVSRFGQHHDIMLYDLQSEKTYRLTRDAGNNESPSWSPDGRQIAFESDRSGVFQVFVMNADGGNLRQLTFKGENSQPDWSN